MSHICIRRTKEMQNSKGEHLVPLPPVEMTLVPVQLDPATRVSDTIDRACLSSPVRCRCSQVRRDYTTRSRHSQKNSSLPTLNVKGCLVGPV